MKLGALSAALGRQSLPAELAGCEVRAVVQDSRQVVPGSLFVAVRGFHSDGHRFIGQALERGAVAVVAEEAAAPDVPGVARIIRVPDSRKALAQLATEFFGRPSERLALIGITGTNGKTTTSYLIKAIIEAAGGAAGLIGTIDYRIGKDVYPAPNTTPESVDLQRLLGEMVSRGASHCVMEVSSHALALGRTEGCRFRAAAFTNLTQDHLDFHKTMDAYFEAKLSLFSGLGPDAVAVVNRDDPWSGGIIGRTRARVLTFGFSDDADVRPRGGMDHGIGGLAFDAATPSGTVAVRSPLVGKHNVYNILTAVALGSGLGLPPDAISGGIAAMQAVPGRMEKVDAGQPFGVIVDYAHTEDALTRLLEAVAEVAHKRIITVFGCGGDRDRTKRPKMGAAAIAASDVVIATSDNPRSEDPAVIIAEIEAGMRPQGSKLTDPQDLVHAGGAATYFTIPDRHAAIELAVNIAQPGDVVVLAGKGHEEYQIIGDRKTHFNDREEARRAIARRGVGR